MYLDNTIKIRKLQYTIQEAMTDVINTGKDIGDHTYLIKANKRIKK